MPTTRELDELIAAAGRATALKREAREQQQRVRDAERERSARAQDEALERAQVAAREVFAWLDHADQRALARKLQDARIDSVRITPWMGADGRTLERPCSGAWLVELVPPRALLVVGVGIIGAGNVGGIRERVTTAQELASTALPSVVLKLAEDIRSGRAIGRIESELRRMATDD
jgi:hypothetical protein